MDQAYLDTLRKDYDQARAKGDKANEAFLLELIIRMEKQLEREQNAND